MICQLCRNTIMPSSTGITSKIYCPKYSFYLTACDFAQKVNKELLVEHELTLLYRLHYALECSELIKFLAGENSQEGVLDCCIRRLLGTRKLTNCP